MRKSNFEAAMERKKLREHHFRQKAKQIGVRIAGKPEPQPRSKYPRCVCGCGRRAIWPQGDKSPVFHTRLCGYLMALKIVREPGVPQ